MTISYEIKINIDFETSLFCVSRGKPQPYIISIFCNLYSSKSEENNWKRLKENFYPLPHMIDGVKHFL